MAFVAIPNVAKLEYIYLLDGQIVENVLHYRINVAPDAGNLQTLVTAALVWWNASLKPLVNSAASLIVVRATDQSSATGPVVEETTGLPIVGGGIGTALPSNVTVALKFITAQRGRSYRGRVYHVGLGTVQVLGNTVTLATRNSLRAAYQAAFTLGTAPVWALVVASRFENSAPRAVGVSTLVTDVLLNPVVDSQRRRLPERGS